ncbi:MAG: dependent oxidoreductase [Gammaproteobacteria bacterium]|nr:dependent oxidoreductase [Gammaproteobacteria bacterium]
MDFDGDALVIGAGPAGATAAILLARAGWHVIMVEQHTYPRRKVCGECVAAGNLTLLDELGVGAAFRDAAGPELRRVGWMGASTTVIADMPPCTSGPYAFGRALARDRFDAALLTRAESLGVDVRQPAKVGSVRGELGRFECTIEALGTEALGAAALDASVRGIKSPAGGLREMIRVPVVVDAHGSWERGPLLPIADDALSVRPPRRRSDLFAFKANYHNTGLAPGFLPVLELPGGYGGMVVADGGRTTLACCIRRDALSASRAFLPGEPAGTAVEAFLRRSCAGVRAMLENAERDGAWLSVGPLRPGIRIGADHGPFRVGNAAGESHPLIGEGISMALQSSSLLANTLTRHPAGAIKGRRGIAMHRTYAAAWRRSFAPRLRLASVYAHMAMRPGLAAPARALIRRWPVLLRAGARLAGKGSGASIPD